MTDAPAPEPGRQRRYRASVHWPWRRRTDPERGIAELRALTEALGTAPSRRRLFRRRRRLRPRPVWLRAIRWALAVLVAWIALSVALFIASSVTATGVDPATRAALRGGGLPPFSATTILVLGSDQRPPGSREPGADPGGPSRSDTMMLIRTGGGHSSRLSIPRDTVVPIPGHGTAKINAAFAYGGPALAIRTVESFLGIAINHVLVINFVHFPQLVDAMGGVTYSGSCVVSYINGGFRNGGFTLRLQSGTHHLDGLQALALARTRHNQCAPNETDLTREVRQQKLLLAMKSQMLSFSGFIRMPWIAWALPQTMETDMDAPTLAGVLASLELNGNAHTALLFPTGSITLPDGEQGLTITPSAKDADVARFLRS